MVSRASQRMHAPPRRSTVNIIVPAHLAFVRCHGDGQRTVIRWSGSIARRAISPQRFFCVRVLLVARVPRTFAGQGGTLLAMKLFPILAACLVFSVGGCGPKAASPAPAAPDAEAAAPGPAAAEGDATVPPGASDEPSSPPPSGKVAACTTDASCNADPAISALWGACDVETGKCSCREGAALDPISQRCKPVGQ